ncbi:MAG: YARHG domain-containing protein [Myxococcota bacterium]|nr:YARHG domain-containing protein [Myxococcota bacterium]
MRRPVLLPAVFLASALAIACSGESKSTTSAPASGSQPASVEPVGDAAGGDCASKMASYDGRFKSGERLDMREALAIPADELRMVRNEIFAMHHRPFSSEDLQSHFGAKSWYCADPGFEDSRLSDADRANVALLKSLEGDNAATLQDLSELRVDDGRVLTLLTDDYMEIVPPEMYGAESEGRMWASRGDWLLTWEEGDFKPDAAGLEAWKVNLKTGQITESIIL